MARRGKETKIPMSVHTNHPVAGLIDTMMTMMKSDEPHASGDSEIVHVHVIGGDLMID